MIDKKDTRDSETIRASYLSSKLMRIIPVLGICLSNELAPPQPLAAHQILNFCRPTLVRVFEKFDFPGKSLWCIERALFHMEIFPPFLVSRAPLAQNSKHSPVEADV
jgi:hypothetical protein